MCVDRPDDASSGHQNLVEALASGDAQGYVQDDFRVTSKLTINAGLR